MAKVETERGGGVTIVTINRPEVHNCFDGETAEQMTAAVESFASDDDARVMAVTGAGGRAFCSGAGLEAPGSLGLRPGTQRTSPVGFAELDPRQPGVAAVEGDCFARGGVRA